MKLQTLYAQSLKNRVILLMLAVFLVGIWSLVLYGRAILREDIVRLLSEQQFSIASQVAGEMDREFSERLVALELVGRQLTPQQMQQPQALQAVLERHPILLRQFNGGVIVYRADGVAIADSQPQAGRIGVNYMDVNTVGTALREGRSNIGLPVMGKKLGVPVFGMTVPVRDAQGQILGALAGVTHLVKSNYLDNTIGHVYGKTGGYLLVAPQARLVVTATNKQRSMEKLPAEGVSPPLDRFLAGFRGTDLFINPLGAEVLSSVQSVPSAGWFVAVSLPTEEAFAPVEGLQQRLVWASLLLSVLAAAVTRWLLQRQLTPLWSAIETLEHAAQSPHPPRALPIVQRDEIGKLLGAFNQLLATLAQREQLLQQVLDTSSVAIFVVDQDGRITQANRRMAEMFGCTVEQLVGSEYVNLIHPDERENGRQRMRALMDSATTEVDLDRLYWRADQSRFWGHLSGQRLGADANGGLRGLVGIIADITPRVLAEQFEQFRSHVLELMARSESLGAILQALVQGVEQLNPAMLCSVALLDERAALWVACAPSLPPDFNQLLDGKNVGPGIGSCGTAAATRQRVIVDDVLVHPDWAPFRDLAAQAGLRACWSQPIVAASGRVLGTFSIYHRTVHTPSPADITTIEQAARLASIAIEKNQAREKLELAANVFNHAREGIVITAVDGSIIDINQAFTRITGYARDEVLGKNPRILNSGRQGDDYYAAMRQALLDHGHWSGELWNRRKNGEVYAELQTISAVRDANGATLQYVALFSDITTLKEHQQELEHIAHFDALTSLPNRVLLADRMHLAMAQTLRRGQTLAVVFLDLDAFKSINDAHGHEAGDQLLITLASRMRHALRDGDTLARIGGDEFVAVLTDLSDAAASQPLLDRLLDAASSPAPVAGSLLRVTASLGVTFYPQAEDIDADTLLRQADQAMYQAKLGGKNRCHVFDAERDRSVRGHHESLENIRRALHEREFVLYYQPKVNMRTGQVVGAEALIRWQHPEQGLLPPAAFLPVIEDHPLAVEVGEWVIDTALAQMQSWQEAGLQVDVSVNVGARQLQQDDFVARLQMLLAQHPAVHPARLELEVLETSALENITGVSAVIAACAALGVRFALDDFGTGYSSLTYLKRLPASLLKIDQSFVRDMLDDPDDLAILEGVIGLAGAFRRDVIAEGVETIGHGEMLLQLGCHLAQGYGIARPMPAHALAGWVQQWQPDSSWKDVPLVSRDDLPLLFASVELRAWLKAVESHLRGQREQPPALDPRQCHFGTWLHGPAANHHGREAAFARMDAVHRDIHHLADTLCALQAAGQTEQALAGLDDLQALGRDLLDQVRKLSPVRI